MYKTIFLLLFGFSLYAQIIDGASVIVEEKIITLYDIQQEMKLSHTTKQQATDILVRKKLEQAEIKKRGITVSEDEVYDEIRKLAANNNMSISQFYDAVRESNALNSTQLKEKIKERLLSQKLYQKIAMAKLNQPGQKEIEEYFNLHKKEFERPPFVDVVIYSAKDGKLLEKKQHNPMFYSPNITQNSQRIDLARINPQLAAMLTQTKEGSFSPIIPNPQGGYMCFYITKKAKPQSVTLQSAKNEIINAIMSKKRALILDDYFAKLKESADIKYLRN